MQKMNFGRCLVLWVSIFVLGSGTSNVSFADNGMIESVEKFTSVYVDTRRVDIWLPDDYSADGPALPVIYAQDGQNLFRSKTAAWGGNEWEVDETIARLLVGKKIRSAIVIGIWNTPKRFIEYAPQKPWEALAEETQKALIEDLDKSFGPVHKLGALSEKYLEFIVKELKPFVDENYNTLPERADTFVMGSSMGGLISIYALVRYPDVFSGAICLSTHWPVSIENNRAIVAEAIISYLDTTLPQAGEHKIYFDYGTEHLDAWYEPYQNKMDLVMESHGYVRGKDWITMKFDGETHSETAWKKRLHIPIEMMLGVD